MRIPYKNSVIFAGFIGNDLELRVIPGSGDTVCSVRIAAKHSWRDAKEGWKESTEWATAVFYRQDANDVVGACSKGTFIHVEGRKYTRKWTDDSNHTRSSEEIIVTSWHKVDVGKVQQAAPSPPVDGAANPTTDPPRPPSTRKQQTRVTKSYDYSR